MDNKALQVVFRFALTAFGASLVQHAVITADQWKGFQPYLEVSAGCLTALTSLYMSLRAHRKEAILKAYARIEEQERAAAEEANRNGKQ